MIARFRLNIFVLLCSALVLTGAGCTVMVVAGLGALGGYVISPDTVEGIVGYTETELYTSAGDVLSVMGSITEQTKGMGRVAANVTGVRVTVDVIPTSKNTSKLRVKARRWIFPKIAVAQDVYIKIVRKLQE